MGVIEINRQPSRRDLLWFGLILLVFFGLVGTVARYRFDAPDTALGLWIAGGALGALYFAVRPLRIPIYLGWMRLFFPLGWTISHLVLLVLYFAVMTPTAVIMRLLRYDPLRRRPDREATTYWLERRPAEDPSRYLRQY